jgi:hypothetical protein
MAIKPEFPYDSFKAGCFQVDPRDGRTYIRLYNNPDDRFTTSYARYLMSVHLKRLLNDDEVVDHINGDRTDDRLENLQILDEQQNIAKDQCQTVLEHTCERCNKVFYKNVKGKREYRFCSKRCWYNRNKANV